METSEHIYIRLQKHLDSQAVGFPATRSGAEIKILKHIFTPEEAEVATYLSYKFETLETVFGRLGHLFESSETLEKLLDRIGKKGGIETKTKGGRRYYCNAPLVVGMYEMQLERLTPEFVRDFNEYISDKKFGIEFLSTKLPQMRTIPIAKSIHPQHNVATFDEITALLELAQAPFVILECICRKKKNMEGKHCRVTDRKETCLALGHIAQSILASGCGREISRETAMSIIEQNQKQGLVLQPSNTEAADFICSCCGCCCGMLDVLQKIPKPLDFWASNFHAEVDITSCNGCGLCEKRCQVGAVRISEEKPPAEVDLNRCIGCGVCVPTCPKKAITLLKNPMEIKPPPIREDLYDIIMAGKKSHIGKLKLTGKLIVDALRTGQTHLFRGK